MGERAGRCSDAEERLNVLHPVSALSRVVTSVESVASGGLGERN